MVDDDDDDRAVTLSLMHRHPYPPHCRPAKGTVSRFNKLEREVRPGAQMAAPRRRRRRRRRRRGGSLVGADQRFGEPPSGEVRRPSCLSFHHFNSKVGEDLPCELVR